MEIHIQLAGVQLGPYSEKQVRAYLDEGLLSLTDPARFEDVETWVMVKDVLDAPKPATPAPSTLKPSVPAPPAPSARSVKPALAEKALTPSPAEKTPRTIVAPQAPIADVNAPRPVVEGRRSSAGFTTSLIPIPKPASKETIRVPIPQLSKSIAQQATVVKKAIPVEQPPSAPAAPKSSEKARTSLLTAVNILAKKSTPEAGGPTQDLPAAAQGPASQPTAPIPLPRSMDSTRTMPMSVVRAIAKKSDLGERPGAASDTAVTRPLHNPKNAESSSTTLDPRRTARLTAPPLRSAPVKAEPLTKAPSEPETPAGLKAADAAFASARLPQTLRTSPMSAVRALPKKTEPEAKAPSEASPTAPAVFSKPATEAIPGLAAEAVRFVPTDNPPPEAVAKAPPVSSEAVFTNKSLKRTTGSLPSLIKKFEKKAGETASLPPAPDAPPVTEIPKASTEVEEVADTGPAPSLFKALAAKLGFFKTTAPVVDEASPLLEKLAKLEKKPVEDETPVLGLRTLPPAADTVELPRRTEVKKNPPTQAKLSPEPTERAKEMPTGKQPPTSQLPPRALLPAEPAKKAEIMAQLPPDETASPDDDPPVVKRSRKIPLSGIIVLVGLVAAAIVAIGVYVFTETADQTATALIKAIKTGDQPQLVKLVDFPSVRQSLTDGVTAETAKSANVDAASQAAVLAMMKNSINYYVTPEAISALATKSSQMPVPDAEPIMTTALAASIFGRLSDLPVKSQKLMSMTQLVIDLDAAKFDMVYSVGPGWKLEKVELNPDFKLPEVPGAPAASTALGTSLGVPVVETYLADGMAKFGKADWDGAIADYTSVLGIDPKQTIAYSNRGMAKRFKGDIEGAIADFTQAISLDPKLAEAYYNRGDAKSALKDIDGALADFTQAINLDPKLGGAFYNRGTIRTVKGDYDGAITDFTQDILLDPNNAKAYANRGYVRKAQKDLDGAISDFTQALAINPKIVEAYFNRGLARYTKADLDGAILDFNRALDLDPKMTRAYYSRGIAKNTKNDLDGALADYNQALMLDPKLVPALTDRALVKQAKGDLQGALDDFNRALDLDPKIEDAYYGRGLVKEQLGDLDGAILDSSRAIDMDPKRAQAFYNRGFAKLVKGNLDGARTDLLKFCELAPRDPYADHARLYLWLIGVAQNPTGPANQDLSNALQNNWSLAPDDLVTKIAQFLLDRESEADLIAAAASTNPKTDAGQHCEIWYFAGMKRLLSGDKATAIDYFRKCVATGQKDYCEYILAQSELQVLAPTP